jgi:hypothetical protein
VLKSIPFTAVDVQRYAESGRLVLRLQKPKALSDAQIDALLVPVWQNDYSNRKVPSNLMNRLDDNDVGRDADRKALEDLEPNSASVKETLDSYDNVRLSLDEMLRELNEKSGLTDDELRKKVYNSIMALT